VFFVVNAVFRVVVLSGGEPLLRPDIFELAEYGTSLGLRMCMASNGSLVTYEVCQKSNWCLSPYFV